MISLLAPSSPPGPPSPSTKGQVNLGATATGGGLTTIFIALSQLLKDPYKDSLSLAAPTLGAGAFAIMVWTRKKMAEAERKRLDEKHRTEIKTLAEKILAKPEYSEKDKAAARELIAQADMEQLKNLLARLQSPPPASHDVGTGERGDGVGQG